MTNRLLLFLALILSVVIKAQITLGLGSTGVGVAPISTYYAFSYVQQIYTKQEINTNAAGSITGLKFYFNPSISISNSTDWVVYLGHTNKTEFSSTSDWIPVSGLTQVFSGSVTAVNGVVSITLSTPFPYDNVSNLVIAAEENMPGYDTNNYEETMYVYDSSQNSTIYFRNDSVNPDPNSPPSTGVLADYKSVVTFEGLIPNTIPNCPAIATPANNSNFVALDTNIVWTSVSGASSYKVSIGTTPGGIDIANQVSVATTSYTPTNLLSTNTTYYVKVVSVGSGGESVGCTESSFTTVPPLPTNDDCSDAITLTVNSDLNCGAIYSSYTLGATNSGLGASPCYGDPDDDVWFKFVATNTSHRISLLNVQAIGSDIDDDDIYFQVFSGACSSLQSVLCSDDNSAIATGLTVGETYYLRVYSYYGSASRQSFNICIGTIPPPPANDSCDGALLASSFPYTYVQNDAGGATNNAGFLMTCTDGMNDGTWFKFVGDGDVYNIVVTLPTLTDFDPQIGVFSGTCSGLICEDTIDDAGTGGTENISIPTVSGVTYYVNVGNYSAWYDVIEGAFTINITKGNLGTSNTKFEKNNIKAYPNPFSDMLAISDVSNVKAISIVDLSGKVIKNKIKPEANLDLRDLKSGMYMVILEMQDGSRQTIKTIKK